jgi:hypothetical protein
MGGHLAESQNGVSLFDLLTSQDLLQPICGEQQYSGFAKRLVKTQGPLPRSFSRASFRLSRTGVISSFRSMQADRAPVGPSIGLRHPRIPPVI